MSFDQSWDAAQWIAVLLVSAGLLLYTLVSTPPHQHEPMEAGFLFLPLGWALATGIDWLGHQPALQSLRTGLSLLAIHVLYGVVALFLVACGSMLRTLLGKGVACYLLLGAAVILAGAWWGDSKDALTAVWRVLSVATVVAVTLGLVWRMYLLASPSACLVAVAGLWGLGLVADGMWPRSDHASGLQVVHVLYFAYLVALGLVLTGRVHWAQLQRVPPQAVGPDFITHNGFSGVVETQASQLSVVTAIEQERSRIAQDIHDGVGSQLVGLIASLDPKSLQDKRILMGLESCLMDLKMSVDSMNHADTNIFDALGRLRYRMQPSFDRAGIKMLWRVDVAGPLLGIQMTEVSHLVHIVQECFSNILQHSQATKVKLVCHFEPEPEPRLRLEVQDNGKGIATHQQGEMVGNGMANMLKRAKALGVPLHIGTQANVGTRVRLYLPVRSASPSAQA
jgi:signal transduction histidine kinase